MEEEIRNHMEALEAKVQRYEQDNEIKNMATSYYAYNSGVINTAKHSIHMLKRMLGEVPEIEYQKEDDDGFDEAYEALTKWGIKEETDGSNK
jgi:hypothetical protein